MGCRLVTCRTSQVQRGGTAPQEGLGERHAASRRSIVVVVVVVGAGVLVELVLYAWVGTDITFEQEVSMA